MNDEAGIKPRLKNRLLFNQVFIIFPNTFCGFEAGF